MVNLKLADIRNRISQIKADVSRESASAFVYLFGILCCLPLVIHNGYYDITETKTVCFAVSAGVCLVLFVLFGGDVFAEKVKKTVKRQQKLLPTDTAFLLFFVSFAVSALLSDYRKAVFLGQNGRYQGVLTVLAYLAVYFAVSLRFKKSAVITAGAALAFSAVCIFAALNAFGFDPLGIYLELNDKNKAQFLTTIGNVNFYGSYVCLLFPTVIFGFCVSQKKAFTVFFALCASAGAAGAVFTASESFAVGFAAALAVMPVFLFDNRKALRRFASGGIFLIWFMKLILLIYEKRADTLVKPSVLLKTFLNPAFAAAVTVLLAALLILTRGGRQAPAKLKKIYLIAAAALVFLIIAAFVAANTFLKNSDLGALEQYLKITDSWGTNRGRTWKYCIDKFGDYSFGEKLFGKGPETLSMLTDNSGMYKTKHLDQAHNEFLHYLMTVGIAGLASYLALIGGTVRAVLKELKNEPLAQALLCGCIGYWAQSFFNIAQPFSTPAMFAFIACIAGMVTCNAGAAPERKKNGSH